MRYDKTISVLFLISIVILISIEILPQENSGDSNIDKTVKAFIEKSNRQWHDLNVPEADTKTLYDIVLKNKYTKALEIGTSTGRSGIWIAWALSKTGGRLITIEIDEKRYKKALENFRKAGLSDYIDARLADAHDLVKELQGPFDFIFCDADKEWYKNYFKELFPKLRKGGCFAAHNISGNSWGMDGTVEYYNYIKSLKTIETTLYTNGAGLSVSYKK